MDTRHSRSCTERDPNSTNQFLVDLPQSSGTTFYLFLRSSHLDNVTLLGRAWEEYLNFGVARTQFLHALAPSSDDLGMETLLDDEILTAFIFLRNDKKEQDNETEHWRIQLSNWSRTFTYQRPLKEEGNHDKGARESPSPG